MLPSVRSLCLPLLLGLSIAAGTRGQEPHRQPLESQLQADTADGRLDRFELPSASLIAAGVSDESELAKLQSRLSVVLREIDPSVAGVTVGERAKAIHAQLHARVLTGHYDEQATDLRRTLDGGDYNCLSALVLYVELCRRADLPLVIRSQPGHVYCELLREQHIEPASRLWHNPQPVARPDSPARTITQVQLVGKVYYNRGIAQLERREFAAGIESLQHACRLDPLDADARTNLLAGLNNWALSLLEQGEAHAAAALITRGLAIDPHFAPLVANERYLRARRAAP